MRCLLTLVQDGDNQAATAPEPNPWLSNCISSTISLLEHGTVKIGPGRYGNSRCRSSQQRRSETELEIASVRIRASVDASRPS